MQAIFLLVRSPPCGGVEKGAAGEKFVASFAPRAKGRQLSSRPRTHVELQTLEPWGAWCGADRQTRQNCRRACGQKKKEPIFAALSCRGRNARMPDSTRNHGGKRAFLQDPWVRSESEFQLLSGSAPQPQRPQRGESRGSLRPAPLPGLAWLASQRLQAAAAHSKKPRRSAPRLRLSDSLSN